MFVDESRVEEYVRAGHVPACTASEAAPAGPTKKPKRKAKKEA